MENEGFPELDLRSCDGQWNLHSEQGYLYQETSAPSKQRCLAQGTSAHQSQPRADYTYSIFLDVTWYGTPQSCAPQICYSQEVLQAFTRDHFHQSKDKSTLRYKCIFTLYVINTGETVYERN